MAQEKYGYFDENAKEYIITRPDTPLPWINYLGIKDYLGIISNTAGGYSFYRDARLRRISRYFYNAVPKDNPGRYIYICDGDKTWNPSFKPVRTELDSYQCRHGLGYSVITGSLDGLKAQVAYFVPVSADAEVWTLELTNESNAEKNIDLFSYVEFCLWNALDDFTNFQRNWNIGEVEVEKNTIFHKSEYRERRNHYAFFSCSENIVGYDTSRDAFLGNMNDYSCPGVVKARNSANSIARGWSPIGSHHVRVFLKPGQSHKLHFVMGYIENEQDKKFTDINVINKEKFNDLMGEFKTIKQVEEKFNELGNFWSHKLSAFQVDINNEHVRRMVNIWNQYQCMITFNVSRSASSFESGIGRGLGFRDSNQDILGSVHIAGKRSRQRIIDLASTQNSDGSCFHQYQPLTKKGNYEMGMGFSDDPLWLIISTSAYIRETGDWSILDAPAGFADVDGNNEQVKLIDHLHKSVQRVLDDRGPHNLPLIGHADWNDCLNLNCFSKTPGENFQQAGDIKGGVAESVMVAQLFIYSVKDFIEMLIYRGVDNEEAEKYKTEMEKMKAAVLDAGWDGEWFRRAYDYFSNPVGSKECDEGKLFIETQGWAVMAGIGLEDGKARQALDSAWKYLGDENGMVLNQPAFSTYKDHLGEITSYPPGYKENASIFCHSNSWIIIAETILGRGDNAWDLYSRICPSTKEYKADIYRSEPYCFSQTISGKDASLSGEAKNSWLTGTASWMFVAMTQHILGIRPAFEGLCIDPCIPAQWKRFKVERLFRGCNYIIEVENPDGVSKGVKSIEVDGKEIATKILPLSEPGQTINVKVFMGKLSHF
jgi:cellobiose phosphorylase